MRPAGPLTTKPARGRPPKLTQEAIAAGGLAVLDRHGLDGLTLAATAEELGVGVATIYGYLSTKDELVALVADQVLARLPACDANQSWPAIAHRSYRNLYELFIAHPGVAQIFAIRGVTGPGVDHAQEVLLGALEAGGLTGRRQISAYRSLLSYVLGSSLLHVAHDLDPQAAHARRAEQRALDPERYPATSRAWAELIEPTHPDQFDRGLTISLAGLFE
jgi:AcrR family transcriptional regulator